MDSSRLFADGTLFFYQFEKCFFIFQLKLPFGVIKGAGPGLNHKNICDFILAS